MKKIILFIFSIFVSSFVIGQTKKTEHKLFEFTEINDSLELYKLVDNLNSEFRNKIISIAKIKNPDINIIPAPKTKNRFFPGIIGYWKDDNLLSLMFFEQAPPPIKEYLTKFAGNEIRAKELYGFQFFGYCIVHELGHWLEVQFKEKIDYNYDGEYFANQVAVLWWKKTGRQKELETLVNMMKQGLKNSPLSLPENTDLKKYMKENYKTMDPRDYNAIQCKQVIEIYEDKSLPDFDTFIANFFQKLVDK